MNKRLVLILLLATSLVVATGCGESKADKAKKQVCSSKSDIQTQVNKLKGMTLSTATTSQIQDSLNSIKSDLQKISSAQSDLSSDRKQQVQAANQAFTSQFQSILSDLGTNLSIANAKTQLQTATQQLASAYQQSFAKVNCS
jgi:Tfp pilus assembly protein PilP